MMSAEVAVFKEPPALAGLAVRPPSLFLPDKKTAERFLGFFTGITTRTRTRGGRTSRPRAGAQHGARPEGCPTWRT